MTTLTVVDTLSISDGLQASIRAPNIGPGCEIRTGIELGTGTFGNVRTATIVSNARTTIGGVGAIPLVLKTFTGASANPLLNAQVVVDLHSALAALPSGWAANMKGVPFWVGRVRDSGGPTMVAWLAPDLSAAGYCSLEEVLDEHFDQLVGLDQVSRLEMVRSLMQTLQVHEAARFLHADLNPANLFVNLAELCVAVIDPDSGAVRLTGNEVPLTPGKADEYLANEITKSGRADERQVSIESERWAAGILASVLLFGTHPLFFLRSLSPDMIGDYQRRFTWPDVDRHDPVFNASNDAFFRTWRPTIDYLPPDLVDVIRRLLDPGYASPNARPRPDDWLNALTVEAPTVLNLDVELSVYEGRPLRMRWSTRSATRCTLSAVDLNGRPVPMPKALSTLPANGTMQLVIPTTCYFTLTATGPHGSATQKTPPVAVLRLPPSTLVNLPVESLPRWRTTIMPGRRAGIGMRTTPSRALCGPIAPSGPRYPALQPPHTSPFSRPRP